ARRAAGAPLPGADRQLRARRPRARHAGAPHVGRARWAHGAGVRADPGVGRPTVARNPLQDSIAVVGVGSTPYRRDLGRSELSLALEEATRAIDDTGIDKQEVDGLCGTGMDPLAVGGAGFLTLQGALGIETTTWVKNGWLGSCFVYAAEAVFSGLCDV